MCTLIGKFCQFYIQVLVVLVLRNLCSFFNLDEHDFDKNDGSKIVCNAILMLAADLVLCHGPLFTLPYGKERTNVAK